MSRNGRLLEQLRISKSCSADWENMVGGGRVRHCVKCNKQVFNLSGISRDQAEALVMAKGGALCARVERRADGSVVTTEPVPALGLLPSRTSPVAAAVLSVILGLPPNAPTQSPAAVHTARAESRIKGSAESPPTAEAGRWGTLHGVILDETGAVIPGAYVFATDDSASVQMCARSSDQGVYEFARLPPGSYRVTVTRAGFETERLVDIAVGDGWVVEQDVAMTWKTTVVTMGVLSLARPSLRENLKDSNLVVLARVGESLQVRKEGDLSLFRTSLYVVSTVRGKGNRQVIHFNRWTHQEDYEYPSGRTVIAFLRKRSRRPGSVYELVDLYEGSKLGSSGVEAYLQRIREHPSMAKGPEPGEIVEWLVRCAEDPATRWEGSYELARNARAAADDENAGISSVACAAVPDGTASSLDSTETPATAAGPWAVAVSTLPIANPSDNKDPNYALLLEPWQKERLIRALLWTPELSTTGDIELLDLVARWRDSRLVPYLTDQLRRMIHAPLRSAETMVVTLASLIDDEEILELADEYCDEVSYEDEDEPVNADEDEPEKTKKDCLSPFEAVKKRSRLLEAFLRAVEDKCSQSRTDN